MDEEEEEEVSTCTHSVGTSVFFPLLSSLAWRRRGRLLPKVTCMVGVEGREGGGGGGNKQ